MKKKLMTINRISDTKAIKAIRDFVEEICDLDDLAEIYSRYVANGPVMVVFEGEEDGSEVYEDGNIVG